MFLNTAIAIFHLKINSRIEFFSLIHKVLLHFRPISHNDEKIKIKSFKKVNYIEIFSFFHKKN